MTTSHPTCIARVAQVLGAQITARLNADLVGVAPLWRGRLQPVGQVGSIVAIPQGPVRLLATVVLVGLSDFPGSTETPTPANKGDRWIKLQLLGELDALGQFHRGVSLYPGLDDPVHFVSSDVLDAIHPPSCGDNVTLGVLAANADIPITLDIRRLVTRHSVLVGSTGAGKTSAVATIIQNLVREKCTSANVLVIDPHGEYKAALNQDAAVRSVTAAKPDDRLRVPYWVLPASDLLGALTGSGAVNQTTANRFSELVADSRVRYASKCSWINDATGINADTPIPFDVWEVWHQLDYENNLTTATKGADDADILMVGDPRALRPTKFRPHAPNNTTPFKGVSFGYHGTVPDRIRARLADKRLAFFLEPSVEIDDRDPLSNVVDEWLGGDRPVSVLDFSGIPAEVADLAIGVILQILFEISIRSDETHGIGRNRPTLVVIEEAHRYLSGQGKTLIASESANRIAREGRKYGLGLMLVSQRPGELPDTALSQAGTVISLRLAGLAEILPSLRTGEALITGEAISLPSRVLVDRPNPEPQADDPTIDGWKNVASNNNIFKALAIWRGSRGGESE
jgi:hypothetical protein